MPVFADQILHRGASGLGILVGASGLGAMIGALALAARRRLQGLGRWVTVALSVFGVSLIGFALSRSFWLSAVLLVPVGGFMMIQMSASNTLVQAMVPDLLHGRVMSIYSMMFMGLAPVGAPLARSFASGLGAPTMVAAGGVISLIGAAVFASRLPVLRPDARRLIVAQQMAGGDPPEEMTATVVRRAKASRRAPSVARARSGFPGPSAHIGRPDQPVDAGYCAYRTQAGGSADDAQDGRTTVVEDRDFAT